MDTLDFIYQRFNLDKNAKPPIKIMRSRWVAFPRLIKNLGFTVGAEIGVEIGTFAKYLCQDNPELKLYAIDFWSPYKEFGFGKSRDRQNTYYQKTVERLAPYHCEIIKAESMKAIGQFADESLDFVFIDANHSYEHVKEDIQEWSKKVRKGGIVAGHDYYIFKSGNDGVVRAVDEWIKENDIKPLFLLVKDDCPTWFYVK